MKRLSKNRLALIASLDLQSFPIDKVTHKWIKYETGIHESVRTNGSHYTLERYKACYIFLRNRVLELPAQPIPWCIVDSDGIPKPLWSLRPFIKGNRDSKRLALTIARSYERITLPIDYHPKSIDEPALYESVFEETTKDFKIWLGKFCSKYPWYLGSIHARDSLEPKVFTTLSTGPNGPAVSCSHLDAKAVVSDPVLLSSITKLNSVLRQDWITKWMHNMAETVTGDHNYLTGRLGFTAEPAGKTRVFAIGDYWSQTSLKVIQTSLYNTLRAISTDCTANQDKGFKSLLEISKDKSTYCFDLTAASDRIPARLQRFRLELLGGQQLGDAWLSVMTDRDFYVKATKQKIRWAVGQPLGLLSSFPSFALWHHDIVQFAYSRCRIREGKSPIKFFKDYRLLGDDIVIFNTKVADEYQYLIEEVYKISINLNKSVIGDSKNSQMEFTKRLALKGKEMSSIKHNILTKSNMQNMLDLVDIMRERDISPDTGHHGLYPFFSSKEQTLLNFLVWARSDCEAPFNGITPPCQISRESFENLLKEKRSQAIMEKTALIDKYLCAAMPLDSYYKKSSVPYDERALGLLDYQSDNLRLHPLVWAINQTGLDLSITLSTIWDEPSPDVAPVEYLPLVSSESYFSKPRERSKEYISKLIVECLHELSNET